MRKCLLLLAGIIWLAAFSKPINTQYECLIKEIRCVTCPNQSIADSQAPIAIAMREEIAKRLQAGESKEAIREYLFARYGDYITYRPAIKKETWVLWWGPLGILLIGVGIWSFYFSKRSSRDDKTT